MVITGNKYFIKNSEFLPVSVRNTLVFVTVAPEFKREGESELLLHEIPKR